MMHSARSLCPGCGGDKSTERISFENYVVYECGECGVSFGVPTLPVTEASFDNYPWTLEWTRNFPEHVVKARRALAKKREIIAGLTGNYVRTMLDIGCGNGAFLAAAKDLGIQAEGIDIDASHIHFAQTQRLSASHVDIANYHSAQPWDLIHIKESFHLVVQSKQFIERVAELASDKTVVYVDSTHADGLASR
jgi:cyclopropane fatty-acyl-phospholipid synthase-like methyltransferase